MGSFQLQPLKALCAASILGISLCFGLFTQAKADETMLLRQIPLEVSSYTEAANLDQYAQTAQQTFDFMTQTEPLILHMEVLRRAYTVYGNNSEEIQHLLEALKTRYMEDNKNARLYFDYGYAQLVMAQNKNGLFFLRKANDQIANAYTSLAFGMAAVDVDRIFDQSTPEELTVRKMDATYKLKDAILFNREDRLPGVWPTYVRVLDSLKDYAAFDDFRKEDVTTLIVPFGNPLLNSQDPTGQAFTFQAIASNESDLTCQFTPSTVDWSTLSHSKTADLTNDGEKESISFFSQGSNAPYLVQVSDSQSNVLGEFTSYTAPYIVEDLDSDGQFELVIRQFKENPAEPLKVFRWNGECFAEDQAISAFFK